ncbi:EKC/KEOPS complex subunit TP53RK [Episyrphus balteatus]|uniref:EKC/KEOPS complex subunit TP53RK n=1 Tax=Episyrphus balteatus TaxID=286459 RepID=UPI0024861D2A|nr:EKC/KEOPS complex subunit TP53RK [Episyrphus balteatus]
MESEELLTQGAEARVYIGKLNDEKCIIKERFIKKYRHPDLDSTITKQRIKAENNAITRCLAAGVLAPKVLQVNYNSKKIYMEYFDKAITCKEYIKKIVSTKSIAESETKLSELCVAIGVILSKIHTNNIIHGDLTTSNILVDPKVDDFSEYELILIDFGLSQYSQSPEDKGVDLYVLERALLSTHSQQPKLFEIILASYQKQTQDGEAVIARFQEVRRRGRKRNMVG